MTCWRWVRPWSAEEGRIWCILRILYFGAVHWGFKEVGRVWDILVLDVETMRLRDVAKHGELDGSFDVVPPRVMPRKRNRTSL
jgi:hypothetical protein